ncbi:MAG TPA: RHS repeat-associated core domain-containing protein, partial [Chitinispirillaceae bacterium]|nr:RHS repeat-associated core domain-containing protein [Chitinispirillaceae bacterium]
MYDNKGNSVKKYEPFLSSTHEYEEEDDLVQWGVTPILHYDPLGRLVRTEFPDGTESRVVFDAWYQETWDQNDCVTGSRWLTERLATGAPADERTAAVQTQDHADTPSVAYFDSLGRAYLTVEDNGTHGSYETRMAFDIEGNIRSVIDQRGITAFTYRYDIAGTQVYTNNPDAGERWIFTDTAGNPIRTWDSRGHVQRFTYDVLRRATHTYVQQGANPEHLMIRTVYGELLSDPLTGNHRGKVYQVFDGAGVLTNDTYDFKGNLLSSTRHIATEYHQTPNWDVIDGLTDVNAIWTAAQSSLQSQNYSTSIEYDALNRVVRSTTPDSSITVPHYNEANLLDSVEVYIRGAANPTQYVTNIDYNARGQRVLVSYGNGTTTTYDYDPYTFRLSQLQSIRSSDNQVLQDNAYTYDPVGNIISIRDNADWDHLFAREPVSGDGEYVYDPIYRLIQASGREHPGQQPTNADSYLGAIPHPNDTNALIRYTENYSYDQNGNILSMQHIAGAGSWTRDYQYGATGNRLLATSAQGDPPGTFSHTYSYNPHGSMVSMPHLSVIDWDYAERMQHTNLGGGGDVYFTYDATGQRIRKIYEHSGIVEERIYSGGWEIYRRRRNSTLELERETLHVMDGTRKVALIETKTVDTSNPASVPQTRTRYQLDNHLGSASLELDSSSNVISYEEYHPFGTSSFRSADSVAEVSAKRYRYTGKERDDETGLYYYGARYYASWLGRWLSCDPLINDGWNLYVYVRNSPVRFNDPDGRIVSSGALAEGYKSLKNEFKDGYSGIVFTAQAGFVDLSHAKDYADKFLKIHSAIEKSEKGTILLESTVPYVKNAFKRDIGHKKVIREFVYDFSKDKNTIESSYKLLYKAAYIEEKDQGEYGDYSSKVFTSFSYEDITSDMVGGLIGEEIIKLKGLDREM